MPLIIPLTYTLLLPKPAAFRTVALAEPYDDETIGAPITASYAPIPTEDNLEEIEGSILTSPPKRPISLSLQDKWQLVKPLLMKYMLPLCE